MASIAVFCGSNDGTDDRFSAAAIELGTAIAACGHRLVYGGGRVGLMGAVADTALAAGGEVIGVITEHLVGAEVAHTGVTSLEITGSMHERKARMAELSDGVIVLPGGFGTLDESFELLTWNQLGLLAVPVVFLDVAGFFGPLFDFVSHAVSAGFVRPEHAALVQRASTADEAIDLATAPPPAYLPKWVDRSN
jgi:uncharacterized protein (TIGR00730 family)